MYNTHVVFGAFFDDLITNKLNTGVICTVLTAGNLQQSLCLAILYNLSELIALKCDYGTSTGLFLEHSLI